MASKRASACRVCSRSSAIALIGKIAEPIVVAIVPNLGGEFRLGAQRVLPLIGEQTIEFGAASLQGFPRSLGEERDGQTCGEKQVHKQEHERCSQWQTSASASQNTPSENIRKTRNPGTCLRHNVSALADWGTPSSLLATRQDVQTDAD